MIPAILPQGLAELALPRFPPISLPKLAGNAFAIPSSRGRTAFGDGDFTVERDWLAT